MKKFINTLKKPFYWMAVKYTTLPFYFQWLALGIIASPGIAAFLTIWFSLGSMGDHSFVRWILAVIPAMSMILGIVIGMSHIGLNPPKKDSEL